MKQGLRKYVEGMVFNIKNFPVKSGKFTSSTYILIGGTAEADNELSKFQLMNIIILDDFSQLPENCIPMKIDEYDCCIITNNIYSVSMRRLIDENTEYLGINIDPYLSQKKYVNLLLKLFLYNNEFLDDEEMNNVSAEYRNYINNFTKDNGELAASKKDVVKKISPAVENEDEGMGIYQLANIMPNLLESLDPLDSSACVSKGEEILSGLTSRGVETYQKFLKLYEAFILGYSSENLSHIMRIELGINTPIFNLLKEVYSLTHANENGWDTKIGVNAKYWSDNEIFSFMRDCKTSDDIFNLLNIKESISLCRFYNKKLHEIKEEASQRGLIK